MVLFIEGKPVAEPSNPEHLFMLIKSNMSLVMAANQLKSKAVRRCGPDVLYLHQREMAVVSPRDDCVRAVGSDGAATGLIVLIRRTTTGDVSVCRFDGWDAVGLVKHSMERMFQLAPPPSLASADFDVHMAGGYQDPSLESILLTGRLLLALLQSPFHFHLRTACVAHINSRGPDGASSPIIQGVAYDLRTRELTPAEFASRGPWAALRGARVFSSCRTVFVVYDSSQQLLVIEPFSYRCQLPYCLSLSFVAEMPDEQLLLCVGSGQPADKPSLAALRETLRFMDKYRLPLVDIFGRGRIAERPAAAAATLVAAGGEGGGEGTRGDGGGGGGQWLHEAGPSETELLKAASLL